MVVVSSAELGRMIELELVVGGEELGRQPCDGIICSTPSGSTAYNLSNGGPVLMWGLEAIALTYVAAHSLHARPLVIQPVPVAVVSQPIYLHVPPGHAKNWRKHCHKYNACGTPVYFVKSAEYEPGYRHPGKGHGKGHGKGKGHDG